MNGIPKIGKTALLVCDIQEVFRPVIHGMNSLITTSAFLVSSAGHLNLPIVVTEQYPKRLKNTVTELSSIWEGADAAHHNASSSLSSSSLSSSSLSSSSSPYVPTAVFEKTQYSMCTDLVVTHLQKLGIQSAIICGIETHICVLQTALDLLAQGIEVHVPVDAVSSVRPFDRTVALKRLEASGAVLTTSECVLFQLMKDSNHPDFRTVSNLVKEHGQFSKTHELTHL